VRVKTGGWGERAAVKHMVLHEAISPRYRGSVRARGAENGGNKNPDPREDWRGSAKKPLQKDR